MRLPRRPAGHRNCDQSGDRMPVKRRVSKALGQMSELAWRFLNDEPIGEGENPWELAVLRDNHYDHEYGYRVEDLWRQFGQGIVADWIKTRPGTRPYCWWRFESGLERRKGGIQVNGKTIGCNVLYSLRDSIPEDQRAWLNERGLLEVSE